MAEKIKICHVIGSFANGGVEAVIYNYFTHMDLEKFEIHIIGHGVRVKECVERFEMLGFKIHNITPKSVSFKKNCKEMEEIFKKYKFDIVHSHLTEWACVPMYVAWKCGIKVRINHSHMAENPKGLKNKVYYGVRLILGKIFATHLFACGEDAAKYLFGNKCYSMGRVNIIYNAIDLDKYRYRKDIRQEKRKELGISEQEKIIGHIGRFELQKNHKFLIEVFRDLCKDHQEYKLILIGEGSLEKEIHELVSEYGLAEKVIFLGPREDVAELYQAMDIFLFPSFYEGLGIVAIEAQVSNLSVIASDLIPKEAKIIETMKFLPIDKGTTIWKEMIEKEGFELRRDRVDEISAVGYEINVAAKRLQSMYTQMFINPKSFAK